MKLFGPIDDAAPLWARAVDLRQALKDANERVLAVVDRDPPAPKLPGAVVVALRRARMRWED